MVEPELGSSEYFISELMRLYELMGQKSFWEYPERASRAMYGLLYVFCHTRELSEDEQLALQAACIEFDWRLRYVLMTGLFKKEEVKGDTT